MQGQKGKGDFRQDAAGKPTDLVVVLVRTLVLVLKRVGLVSKNKVILDQAAKAEVSEVPLEVLTLDQILWLVDGTAMPLMLRINQARENKVDVVPKAVVQGKESRRTRRKAPRLSAANGVWNYKEPSSTKLRTRSVLGPSALQDHK